MDLCGQKIRRAFRSLHADAIKVKVNDADDAELPGGGGVYCFNQ
jgi:hypothetical protein